MHKAWPSINTLRYYLTGVTDAETGLETMIEIIEETCARNDWDDVTRAEEHVVSMMRVAVMGHPKEHQLIEWFRINGGTLTSGVFE